MKTLIITGGTTGIGRAISHLFAKSNYNVFVGSRTFAKFKYPNINHIKCDVRIEEDIENLIAEAIFTTKRIDTFINCAGFSKWSPIGKVTEKFWNEMIDTNLKGVFLGSKVASQYLQRGGSIINISSIAGKRGSINNSVYCASKFGVNGITQALAKELGPQGIRVNAVCPVYVKTESLLQALSKPYSPVSNHETVEKYFEEFIKNSSLRRLPTASEVAEMCLFLASDKASAITGQCINAGCGIL